MASEYGSALEEACVQLKMLQCTLWTKDEIDAEDEAALRKAMAQVRELQREMEIPPVSDDGHSLGVVKPKSIRRSWSMMLSRSFRKIVGKQPRDLPSQHQKLHSGESTSSTAVSARSSVEWSQESLCEETDEGTFTFDRGGTAWRRPQADNCVKLGTAPLPVTGQSFTLRTQSSPPPPIPGSERDLQHLENQVEIALKRVLIEFNRKTQQNGESGVPSSRKELEGSRTTAEEEASEDIVGKVSADQRIALYAATEVMSALVKSVAEEVLRLDDADVNPPSLSVSMDISEPDTSLSFERTPPTQEAANVLESTMTVLAGILQSFTPSSSPVKIKPSSDHREPSEVSEAATDPAVALQNEAGSESEIGDERQQAIATVEEEEEEVSLPHASGWRPASSASESVAV